MTQKQLKLWKQYCKGLEREYQKQLKPYVKEYLKYTKDQLKKRQDREAKEERDLKDYNSLAWYKKLFRDKPQGEQTERTLMRLNHESHMFDLLTINKPTRPKPTLEDFYTWLGDKK